MILGTSILRRTRMEPRASPRPGAERRMWRDVVRHNSEIPVAKSTLQNTSNEQSQSASLYRRCIGRGRLGTVARRRCRVGSSPHGARRSANGARRSASCRSLCET